MTWHELTEADVTAALNAKELETYRGSLSSGQADPLLPILETVTNEVRGYVARVAVLDGFGVPVSLVSAAVDIAVWRLAKRLQSESVAQREPAADKAYERLQAVAAGEIAVDTDVSTAGGSTVSHSGAWGSETKLSLR